ncbi:MAG: DNA mismatch repair endonuclease MutL [Culicoidibacterales bacterium]
MSKILVMDPILANKIAAGEVVERPASVVKELVENAIDAGARSIEVHLVDSGIQSIQIIDDGSGMTKEDAELAFLRHATSKIQTDMDLFRIQSLGFRGEALPAIASVSKVVMRTGTEETEGVELELHGGKKIRENSAVITGTQFKVSDLFYNTPARLNYLKSLQAELATVTDFIQKIAIAYPKIAFTYTNNDMELLRTRGDGNVKHILSKIFGIKIGESLIAFSGESTDFRIEGYFAKPENQRYNRNGIYLIVNGRIIRNYVIMKAIMEAFHTYIPDGRYPICYISIQLDPMLIDVNVHPTKQEVRITQEKDLAQLITKTIRDELMEATKPADLSDLFETFNQPTEAKKDNAVYSSQTEVPSSFYSNTLTKAEKEGITLLFQDTFKEKTSQLDDELMDVPVMLNQIDTTQISFDTPPIAVEQIRLDDEVVTNQAKKLPIMQIIGQYNGTYIMAQNEDGMYIIDQHAAAERIKYEKYLKQMGERTFHYQQLTTPVFIDLTQDEQQKLEQWKEVLEAVGIRYRAFSESSIAIDELPTWIEPSKQDRYLRMVFDWLSQNGQIERSQIIEAAAIMLSCKLSIKANHALTLYEMQSIIDQLELCENPFTCPHGRPTIILKRLYDFEKWFKRV